MSQDEGTPELTRISTNWDLLFQAHQGQGDVAFAAQRQLLKRYCEEVYRYLLSNVHDPSVAEDLSQEFALRFVRGDFRRASPQRGRFRDYVKAALFRLIIDHRRAHRIQPEPLSPEDAALAASDPQLEQTDKEFASHWRAQLLNCTWEALAAGEARTGQLFYTVLRWRVEHPDAPAAQLAGQLERQTGRPFTEAGIRQTLHRARVKFAELLVEEVARSLQTSEAGAVEQELADLELLAYCRPKSEGSRQ
jgi:RNA polymerase sigma factor (sigma-70 family)